MIQGIFLVGTALTAFLLNLVLTPLIIRLSHRYKWYDRPNKRKIHKGLIPRLGGIGIFLTVLLIGIGVSFLLPRGQNFFETRYLYLLGGFTLIHLAGLFDDLKNMRALIKLLMQVAAASIVVAGGFLIDSFTLPYIGRISLGIIAYPITIAWIVGLTNAINLVDGMDGLAGGITGFAIFSMGVIAVLQGVPTTALLAMVMFGSVAGFLVFNFPPAKIFMGDSGSLFLGFSLAVLPLMGISKTAAVGTLIIPITLLTIPIIDILSAIIRRIRQGRSIFSADMEHIHHKLLDMGLAERKILLFIYSFSLYLGIVAVTSVILPKETNVYLIIIVWIGSLLAYYFLDFLKSKRTNSSVQKQNKKSSSAS